MKVNSTLSASTLSEIEDLLAPTDELLSSRYPGDRDVRQPVHTVYVPADVYTPELPGQWGRTALEFVEAHGGLLKLAEKIVLSTRTSEGGSCINGGLDHRQIVQESQDLAEAVRRKLLTEPIEDLRLDFEDGFGARPDAEEDEWAVRAAAHAVAGLDAEAAPAFIGIRFKCLEKDTRARGLRTLDLFVGGLLAAGGGRLPSQLVLTLPKVSTPAQVEAMVVACRALEDTHGLERGTIGFEVQVETPQIVLGPDGTVPLAQTLTAGEGRITSLHYGTYDYSASMGVAAAFQASDHPVADFAKNQMQLAVAGTGVHLSDGSTNILPLGDDAAVQEAWELHAQLVRRHLERGIYQGWDLHAHQLPTRFLATFHFYREGFAKAAKRLRNYVFQEDSTVLDEPATAKALAKYLERGLACGAISEDDLLAATRLSRSGLEDLARTGATATINA